MIPVLVDRQMDDLRWVEHWAMRRVRALAAPGDNMSLQQRREAAGAAPVQLLVAHGPPRAAAALRAAFGLMYVPVGLMEWALQLPVQSMPEVRRVAAKIGLGPVLAVLELAGYMGMYTQLAREEGVDMRGGLAWR